jgi:DHA1 family putative efflux transporter-like MFS transporter
MLKSHPRSTVLILALGAAAFSAAWNFTFLAPVLHDVADDTGVSVSAAGQLVTASALVAVICMAALGPLTDRNSRRSLMMIGLAMMVVSGIGSSLTSEYGALLSMRLLSGAGDALLLPATYVAAADYFKGKDREVALNVLLVPLGAAVVVGLPIVVAINEVAGWQAAFAVFAVFNLFIMLAVRLLLPAVETVKDERSFGQHYRESYGGVLGNQATLAVLLAAVLGAATWNGMVTYVGAFFEDELGAEGVELAVLFALVGGCYVAGGGVGIFLARRSRPWPIAVWSAAAASILPLAVVSTAAVAPLAVMLGMAFAASRAPGVGALNNMLMDLAPGSEGTAISLHGIVFMSGALVGAVAGGLAISAGGYVAMGALFAVLAVLSLTVLLLMPAASRESAPLPAAALSPD